MPHPLETMMQTTMDELKKLVDVNTIVGQPVSVSDGAVIVPVSRVTLGFVTGGGEYGTKNPVNRPGMSLDNSNRAYPFAGTMTAGVSVTPVAFLSVRGDKVSVLPAGEETALERAAARLPEITAEILDAVRAMRKGPRVE